MRHVITTVPFLCPCSTCSKASAIRSKGKLLSSTGLLQVGAEHRVELLLGDLREWRVGSTTALATTTSRRPYRAFASLFDTLSDRVCRNRTSSDVPACPSAASTSGNSQFVGRFRRERRSMEGDR
jgi:hypothetical protein